MGIDSGDQVWIARYILNRVAEDFGTVVSYEPKPIKGDWNGAGSVCNLSLFVFHFMYFSLCFSFVVVVWMFLNCLWTNTFDGDSFPFSIPTTRRNRCEKMVVIK